MSDELNPSTTPKVGGSNQSAANESNDDGKPRKRQAKKWFGLTKTQWRELAGILILIPWVWNDLLDSHNFSKLCLLAISLVAAQGLAASFLKPRWIAITFGFLSLIPVAAMVWINSRPEPKPNFTISLQIGDSADSTVILTNDFLFAAHFENSKNFPNGHFLFHARADGCIVIPVQSGESNKVFNFLVHNDSSITVNDLDVSVGFSKNLGWLADQKWHESVISLYPQGKWKLDITNLQCWVMQSPWVLFPFDSWHLPPITNDFNPNDFNPAYFSPTNKSGLVQIDVRSTDFERLILANIMIVPAPSNFSKPFVARMKQGTDGFWRVSISQKELEDSQK
ncbi:MAG TPA: hypothetical protein VHY30_11270 [Verrucomicrobiae bacterium]|jgi:hypothetical protein|nr:hypothetical protein [Verrucomicrobiae bacterium]